MAIAKCDSRSRLLDFPKIHDVRGNLTFVEGNRHVPFGINRVYYLYDVPGGVDRGAHAHKSLRQVIIALSGSFEIRLDNGNEREIFFLNRADRGLYVPPMHWRELGSFSSGSVCLVLASALFDEADYIRDRDEFLRLASDAPRSLP